MSIYFVLSSRKNFSTSIIYTLSKVGANTREKTIETIRYICVRLDLPVINHKVIRKLPLVFYIYLRSP